MFESIRRKIVSIIQGNGIFPSEKDWYITRLEQSHSESVDDFMRLFSWMMYIENKYNTYHEDGPIAELFEQIWAGEDSPYDKMIGFKND
jgi:hypothetical protein